MPLVYSSGIKPEIAAQESFFAVNFVQYLKDNGIVHTAVDTDNENSTLKRFHSEASFLDIGDPTEIDAVFATLDKADLVVMDCRAASTDIFLDYFEEVRIFDLLKSVGATLNLIMPVNHETDSVEQIRNISDRLNRNAQYLVVKNQALSERFANYESSATRTRLLDKLTAKEITMPKLYDWLVSDLTIRVSLQTLAQLAKEFSKETRELTQEIRSIPKVSDQLSNGRAVAFLCVAIASLLTGILIGKFLF